MNDAWLRFTRDRDDWLRALGEVVRNAVCRHDTDHPAFHGCVDWHSAVHGTLALLAVSRLTGDQSFRDTALEVVGAAELLTRETDDLVSGRLPEELPYGFAWALLLDLEAHLSGITRFHTLATAARAGLVPYLSTLDDIGSTTYRSSLWAAFALHRWAVEFGDLAGAQAASEFASRAIHAGEVTMSGDGFLSPPHLLVLLASQVGASAPAVERALAVVRATRPLGPDDIGTPYAAGLNFSRAWGCAAAWRLTGDSAYRDLAAELIGTHVAQPFFWARHYLLFGHWVAQFGVFAIHLTEDGLNSLR